MHYSIKSINSYITDNPLPAKIEWSYSNSVYNLFKKYKQEYIVKNDATFLNFSYFELLCRIYRNSNFSIKSFLEALSQPSFFSLDIENGSNIASIVLEERIEYYYHVYCKYNENNAAEGRDVMQAISIDEFFKSKNIVELIELIEHEYDNYEGKKEKIFSDQKARTLVIKEINLSELSDYLCDIKQKNHAILTEFRTFISGFINYIKEQNNQEYSRFKLVYNLLHDEFAFLQNAQIDSLKKYKLVIGKDIKKHTEVRGKSESFVPSGLCHYGTHVFINSFPESSGGRLDLWDKRYIMLTFFHEFAHALDYLYHNEKILKNQTALYKMKPSHNREFLHSVKLNYFKFKSLKNVIPHKISKAIDYYCCPQITHIQLPPEEPCKNDITDIFGDFLPSYNHSIPKEFSPDIYVNNIKYNYGRVLQESWAESFSFIFNWMKNSFCEYDHFIIKAKESYQRVLIKSLYHSLIYLLYNFDWTKLNIPYSRVLKKRVEIREFLDYVNDMPVRVSGSKARKFKTKKYHNLKDIKKLK